MPSSRSDSWHCRFLPAMWGAWLLFVVFSLRTPIFGPDHYWAGWWLLSYANGFQRRSLLGSLLAVFGGVSNDYWFIAILSWIVFFAFWSALFLIVLRFLRELEQWRRCFYLTVFLLSPAWTGLALELLGDPLQVVFLAFVILIRLLMHEDRVSAAALVTWAAFASAAILIHEASIFFVLPALGVIALDRPGHGRVLVVCSIAMGVSLMSILAAGAVHPEWARATLDTPTLAGFSQGASYESLTNDPVALGRINADLFRSFRQLLRADLEAFWAAGVAFNLRRLVGAVILPLMQAWVICLIYAHVALGSIERTEAEAFRVWRRWYVCPMAASLPLWIIAHDWGRFAGYTLMLQTAVLFTLARQREAEAASSCLHSPTLLGAQVFVCCLALAICTSAFLPTYRVGGVSHLSLLVPTALLGVIVVFLSRFAPKAHGCHR